MSDFFSLAVHAGDSVINNGAINLNQWQQGTEPELKLSGNWRFFPDELVAPAQILKQPDSRFVELGVPSPWNKTVSPRPWPESGHGVGTYWITFTGGKPEQPTSLSIKRSCSNAAIYFFAQSMSQVEPLATLGTVGQSPLSSSPYAGRLTVPLPFGNSQTHHLLIQVSNFSFHSGGLCGDVILGTTEHLDYKTLQEISIHSMLIALIGVAGMYLLALYSQNRQSKGTFWFMLMCLSSCVFFFTASGLLELLANSQERWLYELRTKLIYISLTWSSAALPMFYASQFPHGIPPAALCINRRINLVATLFFAIAPTALITALTPLAMVLWGGEFIAAGYILCLATWKKSLYTKTMLAAILPLALAIPHDVATHTTLNTMPVLSLSCLVFFIFVHSLILGRKFSDATALAEKLSANLMREVELRTVELHDKNKKLEKTQRDLEEANEALKKLSITDGLTRIYNRMYFDQELRKEWRRSARLRKSISILMLDVDHFKKLNDTAGHLAGDQALQSIARTLHNHFKRAGELVARYGGEEFVVMLPNTDQRKALAIAEGLRHTIEQQAVEYNGKPYRVTVSIGISTTTPSMRLSAEHLLAAADSALYKAKNAGRNRVETIPLLPSQPYGKRQRQ